MVHTGGESPQDGLGDMQTCEMTLASAYVLYHLSVVWLQFPMEGRCYDTKTLEWVKKRNLV